MNLEFFSQDYKKLYEMKQLIDFKEIRNIYESYIFKCENWDKIIKQFSNVLNKCDSIDFEEDETALAYTIFHFLDRYHRFQILIRDLWNKGYLRNNTFRKIDILEIGSGPAQGLFAFSEHFLELSTMYEEEYSIRCNYVEKSNGFKNFLHHFVEYAMQNDKYYKVPFHHARAEDAFHFPFQEQISKWRVLKHRYDIVLISNFLTNDSMVENFRFQMKQTCKYMRNNGLLIIIGATSENEKYKEIYKKIDRIIIRKFKDNYFYGWWTKTFDKTYVYNYSDEYGELLRSFYNDVKNYIIENDLWDNVPIIAKDNIDNKIKQTAEKTRLENWNGVKWKVTIYQKHSFYNKNKN